MACSLTQGHTPKTCKSSGGTKSFLIAEYESVTAITKTAGVITAITKASGKKFWKYKQKAEVANWKQTGTGDPKVGTIAYDVEATIEMVGLDQLGQTELGLLMANTVVMIAEDNDGTYWYLGEDFGMDLATDGLESGTAIGDFRGNKLSFKGRAYTRVASVSSTIIAGLLA